MRPAESTMKSGVKKKRTRGTRRLKSLSGSKTLNRRYNGPPRIRPRLSIPFFFPVFSVSRRPVFSRFLTKAFKVSAGSVAPNFSSVFFRTASSGVSPSNCSAMNCSASRKRKNSPETGSLRMKNLSPFVSWRRTVKSLRSLGAEVIIISTGLKSLLG